MNPDWRPGCSLSVLKERAECLALIREFFAQRNILEVQTATLCETSVTDVEIESVQTREGLFLQTSPEYQMKRLLAHGSGSIYQICPAYRANEQGRYHNTEFTMVEWYRVGWDERALQDEVAGLVDQVLGKGEYQKVRYDQLVLEHHSHESESVALDEGVRKLGKGRYFITHYPAAAAALARLHREDVTAAARFELIVDGIELANGYYELGDAQQLNQRFETDNLKRKEQGLPNMEIDETFLGAMQAGLPKCAGVALGFDRLLMLRVGADHIKEVIAFT